MPLLLLYAYNINNKPMYVLDGIQLLNANITII